MSPASAVATPEVVLVAAVARNGVIGRGNDLVFRDPADHKHFRELTWGHPVVMGRRTWESLPERFRPLPGRRNVVVSRNPQLHCVGAETVTSLEEALALLQAAPRVCVIGGGQLYAQALPLASGLELTEVHADLDGDTHFPAWDRGAFDEVSRLPQTSAAGPGFDFVSYRRRSSRLGSAPDLR
jgi:dihydrofolate reductase